jgi:hypothetical protein
MIFVSSFVSLRRHCLVLCIPLAKTGAAFSKHVSKTSAPGNTVLMKTKDLVP